MPDGQLVTWEDQSCAHCESTTFVALTHLRVKPGGGTIPAQAGYQCSQCGRRADMAEMQRAAFVRQRRREMAELEAELAAVEPAASDATKAKTK